MYLTKSCVGCHKGNTLLHLYNKAFKKKKTLDFEFLKNIFRQLKILI